MKASSFTFTGSPIPLSVKELTAQAGCSLEHSDAGPIYENTLSWETDGVSPEVLEQISDLEASPCHFVLETEDGFRKLIFNWGGIGKIIARDTSSGEEHTLTPSLTFRSRMPIITIT